MGRFQLVLMAAFSLLVTPGGRADDGKAVSTTPSTTLETLAKTIPELCETALTQDEVAEIGDRWAGKKLVVDTNVALTDPGFLYKYPGADIIIGGTVIEEIDGKKNDERLGFAARRVSRELIGLLEKSAGAKRIPLGRNSFLIIDQNDYTGLLRGTTLDRKKKDNELLSMAISYGRGPEQAPTSQATKLSWLRRRFPAVRAQRPAEIVAQVKGSDDKNVFIITDDVNVRIKAFGLGLQSKPHEIIGVTPVSQQEDTLKSWELTDAEMERFLATEEIAIPEGLKIWPNEFVMFKSPSHEPSAKTVGRYRYNREDPSLSHIHQLPTFVASSQMPGEPLNIEQSMVLDLGLDDTVDAVAMEADAGTGKTFLSVLIAMTLKNRGNLQRVYISRPTVVVGRNHPGALPGGIDEKYSEWKKPFIDNFNAVEKRKGELLLSNGNQKAMRNGQMQTRVHQQRDELPAFFELLPFEFIRGRSISDSLIVVDEFQNTSIHEAKSMLTRVGRNSKVIIMGNEEQIDDPGYLNANNNGLSASVSVFRSPKLTLEQRSRVGVVRLVDGVRSPFAELTTKGFKDLSISN